MNKDMSDSKEKKLIAVFGSALHNEKQYSFLIELEKMCEEQGYFILAFSFSGENMHSGQGLESELTLLRLIQDIPLAAIIMLRESLTSEMLVGAIKERAAKDQTPLFSLEKPTEGCINIIFDYHESFKQIVRHIIDDHGIRRIAMIAGIKDNLFSDERIDAYKCVLKEHDIPFEESLLFYGDFWEWPTRAAVEKMIARDDVPPAICCANDAMAKAAVQVLKEHEYLVPEDVIVTGFDGIMSARFNDPPISTMAPDYAGEVKLILDFLNKDGFIGADKGSIHKLLYSPAHDTSCGCTHTTANELVAELSNLSAAFSGNYWLIDNMNHMVSTASELDDLTDLHGKISVQMETWMQVIDHVGVFSELLNDDFSNNSGHTYRTLFRNEGSEYFGLDELYPEQIFMPGFYRILQRTDIKQLLLIRLLHTGPTPLGYTVEGFSELSNVIMRRCEIISTFISTVISIISANQKLRLLNKKLMSANKEIADISVTDYLTGILNRRGFLNRIKDDIADPSNEGSVLTVFAIDMDGLKAINDKYGHEEGDFAIKTMADAIKSFSARNGFCSRYGGDEFACALITDTELDLTADDVRERIHAAISRKPKALVKKYKITASIGSCSHMITGDAIDMNRTIDEMLRTADENMYKDKQKKSERI